MYTRFHHVANGTSTTMTITDAGIPGTWSIWADPLYEGPVPSGLSDAELMHVRLEYLGGPADDPVIDLRNWRSAIETNGTYDELVLWFEHDLFDQLNLIQLLSWIGERLPPTTPVSLICIGTFPGRPRFKGLGELTPEELAPLLDTRQLVSDEQYALAERAWLAFREPTPEALDDLRRGDTAALPYLAAAISRFLQEYPWTATGLSRSEHRLLQLAEPGRIDLWTAFPHMDDGEDAYYMTDLSLIALAESLSSASPPLLVRHTERGSKGPSLTLTESGRAVLAGKRDKVAICGIDRWLGGVHLTGREAAWRWDDESRRIVKPTGQNLV